MKGFALLLILSVLVSLSQAVVISWEESLPGKIDYRFFYFDIPAFETNYEKPYWGLVDGLTHRPYGTLGSLDCDASTSGVAVYMDTDGDDLKEWDCVSINILPFAEDPTSSNPPICDSTTPPGSPTLFNTTSGSWECTGENHILTLAQRNDFASYCQTADFMVYDGFSDLILCIDPTTIDESATNQGKRDVEERVDPEDDAKWHIVNSQIDSTGVAASNWHRFKWTPDIAYDFSLAYSLQPSPPTALPFDSSVIAVTWATFRVNGYLWNIATPTGGNSFTGRVVKLSRTLGETNVAAALTFNSVTATTGQVTFGLSTLGASTATAGETFVADYSGLTWSAFASASDRLLISVTLWIETKESFTEFFFTD